MATTEQSIGSLLSSTSILSQPPQPPPPSKVNEISYRRLSTNSSLSALNSKSSVARFQLLYSTNDTGDLIFSQSQPPPLPPLKSTILELPSNINNNNNCNQHLSSFNEDKQTELIKQDANSNSTQLFQLNHQTLSSVRPTFRRATSAALCSKLPVNLTRAVHGCHAHQSPTNSQQPHQPHLHSQPQTQCSNMSKYSVGSSNIGHCNNHSLYPSSSASSGASSPCPSSLPPGKSSGSVGGGARSNLGAKISYYSHNSQNHQHGNYQHHHQPGTVRNNNNKPHYFQHHHNHPNQNHHHHHSHNQHQSSPQQSNSCFSSHYPNQFEYGLKSFSSSSCNSPVHHQQTVLLSPGGNPASPVHHINRQSIKNYNHSNSGGPGAPSATVIGSNCTTPTKSLGHNTGNKPDILLDRKAFINLEKSINWKLLLNSSISTATASTTTTTTTTTNLVATSGATNEMSTTPATTTTTTSTTIHHNHDHHNNHSKKPRQTIKSSLQPNFTNSNNANANINEAQHQLHIHHHHHQQQQQQPHPQQQAPNLDFTLPGMKDVPSWLKLLRLHKYASFFARMSYEEMLNLTETDLEHQNITKGARQKLILSIQKLKARSAVLLVSECNFLNCSDNFRNHRTNSSSSTCTGATGYNTTISYNTLSHVLFQIRAFLSTPIRPSSSSSLVSAPVIATGKSSEIGSNQMVVSNCSVVNDYCTIVSQPQTALLITSLPSLSPGASNHCLPGESLMSTSVDIVPSEYALSPTSSSSSSSLSSSSSASSVDVNNNSSQHHNYQANSLVIRTGNSALSSRHTDSSSRWPQLHQLSTSNVKTDCQDDSLIDNVPVDHQQLLQCWSTLCNDQLSDIMTRLIGHVHHILVSKCKKRLKKLKLWQYFFKDIYDKLLILNSGAKRNEIGALDQYEMSNIEQMHRKGGNVSEQSPTLVISTSQTSSNDSDRDDEDEEDSALVDCDMNDGSSSLADKDSHTTTSDSSNSSTPKTFQHCSGNGSADKDSGVDEAAGDSDNSSDSEILKVEHEEELYSMMRTVLDKCLSHEAFQQYSILFVHWREQLQLMINSLHYIVNDSLLISSLSPPLAPIGVTGYCDLGHSNGYHQNHHHHNQNDNLTNYSSSQSSQYSNFHSPIHHRNHQQSQQHSSNSFQQSVSHKSMSPTNESSGKTPLLPISKNNASTSAAGALSSSKTSSICASSCSTSLSLSSSSLSSTSSLFLSNSSTSSSSSTSLSSMSNLQQHHYHYQNNPNQSNRRLLQLKQLYSGQPQHLLETTATINDNHHNNNNNNNNRFNDKHPKLANNFNNNINNKDFSVNQNQPPKQSHHYKHRYNTSNLSVISSASSQQQVSDTPVASNSLVNNGNLNNNIPNQTSGNLANSASVPSSTATTSSASIFLNNNNNNSSPELNFRKLLLQQLINNQHQVQTQPAPNCSNTTIGNTGGHYCSQNSNNQELSSSSSMLTSESLPFNSFNTSSYDTNQQIQQFKTVDSDRTTETQDSMLDNEFNFSSIDFDDCRKQWNLLSEDVGNSDDKNINGLYRFTDQPDQQQIIDQNNCWSNGSAYFDSKLEDSAVEFNGTSITGSCNLTVKFSEFNVSATTTVCTDNHNKMTFNQNHERNSDNLLFPDLNPALSSLTTVGTLTRNDQQHPDQSVQHRSNRIGQNVAGGDCNGGVNRDVDCDDQHLKNSDLQQQQKQQQVANSTSTFINNKNNSITTDLDDIEQLCIRMAEHALEI